MNPRSRHVARILAWVVFLVGTPLLIALAGGYQIGNLLRPQSSLPVPSVGALVVRTTPRDATVEVDGAIVANRTPSGVGRLVEGEHVVRIEKAGYRPFEKRVSITGGRVTDLLHVVLLPENSIEAALLPGVEEVLLSPNEQWIAVRRSGTTELFELAQLFLPQATAPVPLVRIPVRGSLQARWAPNSEAVLFSEGSEAPDTADVARFVVTMDDRTLHRVSAGKHAVGWFPDSRAVALTSTRGELFRFDLADFRERSLHPGAQYVTEHPRGLLLVSPDPLGNQFRVQLLSESGVLETLTDPLPELPRTMVSSYRGDLAALDSAGRLSVWLRSEERWRPIAGAVTSVSWAPDGEKLLYQTSEFDLSVVNVAEERSALVRWAPTLLVRLSSPISEVRWFPDSQHILYVSQDILSFTETDPRESVRESLISLDRGTPTIGILDGGTSLLVTARRPDQEKPDVRRPVLLRLLLRTPADIS